MHQELNVGEYVPGVRAEEVGEALKVLLNKENYQALQVVLMVGNES